MVVLWPKSLLRTTDCQMMSIWPTSRPTSGAPQEGFGFEVSIPPLEISAFFQQCHYRASIAGTKIFFIYNVTQSHPLHGIESTN